MSTPIPNQKTTPMMAQWHACKKAAKNALLLFRMGDFYEAFYEDAQILAKELELTLTKRQGIPMSGIPQHTIENYTDRLVCKGHRVAVAEQMEDPRQVKGIVKREVVRVVTAGSVVNSSLISDKTNNFFASIDQVGSVYGFSFLDLTTGEFRVIELENKRELLNEIHRLRPSEFLSSKKFKEKNEDLFQELQLNTQFLHNSVEEWHFDHQTTYSFLVKHFKVHTLDGFGLKGLVAGINAAGALLAYMTDELKLPTQHISHISNYSIHQYMSLDRITQKNLELTESLQDGSKKNTLLDILDHSQTPMGGRMLRQWIKQPLLSIEEIQKRQKGITELLSLPQALSTLGEFLSSVRDLERLNMKVCTHYATPKDLVSLRTSLEQIPQIHELLIPFSTQIFEESRSFIEDPTPVASLIAKTLVDDPPLRVSDGSLIRPGFHKELDELQEISRNSKTWLANYQTELRQNTGIKTIKVGFNRVFGYFIEVSKGQASKMPNSFQRRQTLVNTERFISPELKDYESKVLSAEEKISLLEGELFLQLKEQVAAYTEKVKTIAQAISVIDCIYSLAISARDYNYVRPEMDESFNLSIQGGRHPVIENASFSESFVPNDTVMDFEQKRLFLITGPNMAGKSTYIRQVALIQIMGQMGSFVPANQAQLGLVDKVFTRIGASDDLTRGQSTFMVEMTETANILNHATERSLVILDEIGRGTSTYDGISIAWAVAEYLLTQKNKTAKTLFATHYWELTKLEGKIPGAVNYNVAVQENEEGIIFLHKIIPGSTDKSYGIHVARLAGLPIQVITRSKELLIHLEENANRKGSFDAPNPKKVIATKIKNNDSEIQLLLFEPSLEKKRAVPHRLIQAVQSIDVNELSPIEAQQKLIELTQLLGHVTN